MQLMNRLRQMRILLDENFPIDFVKLLVGHEVTTLHVHSLGWSGIKNGELLRHASEFVEKSVQQLPPEELAKFRRWYAQFDADAWDAQIEADAAAGKLDALAAEALAEYHKGQAQEL